MSKREIIILAFKLIAIFVIIQSLFSVTGLFIQSLTTLKYLLSGGNLGLDILLGFLPYLVGLLLYLGLGFHIWTMAESYANKMSRELPTFNEERKVVPEDIREIAFSVVGIFIVASAIPQVVHFILLLLQGSSNSRLLSPQFITAVVKLAIGFWLLLGSKGIINLIKRVRGMRITTEPPQD